MREGGHRPMMFGTNHASAKRSMKVPSPPLKISLSEFELTSGGEGQGEGEQKSFLNSCPPHPNPLPQLPSS